MAEQQRGGQRRRKRHLTPQEKSQVWQEVVAGQGTQREIAERWGIDRSTVTHIIKLAKRGALERLATSKPGRPGKSAAELALEDAQAETERLKSTVTVLRTVPIVSALRALRVSRPAAPRPELAELSERLRAEHRELGPRIDGLRRLADSLDHLDPDRALAQLQASDRFVRDELLPHEFAEEDQAFPLVAASAGRDDPTPALKHTHREILRLSRLLHTAIDTLDTGQTPEDLPELRRLLYGLHAVIRLHNAQEEEAYGLLDQAADPIRA